MFPASLVLWLCLRRYCIGLLEVVCSAEVKIEHVHLSATPIQTSYRLTDQTDLKLLRVSRCMQGKRLVTATATLRLFGLGINSFSSRKSLECHRVKGKKWCMERVDYNVYRNSSFQSVAEFLRTKSLWIKWVPSKDPFIKWCMSLANITRLISPVGYWINFATISSSGSVQC